VPKPPPESTKVNLRQRLTSHAENRWPALAALNVRYHGLFAYIDGQLPDGTTTPLCRLRYNGSAHIWGFAIYLASRDGYQDSTLPTATRSAPPKKPSTAPAASTSATPPPGTRNNPRRTSAQDHLATMPATWTAASPTAGDGRGDTVMS
jgi:hypothetical protein